jgi:phage terminase large subunit-like protein
MTNQCKHAIKDNLGYTNCTKNDSTIGYCQQPCPYRKQQLQLLTKSTYIFNYAETERFLAKEGRNKPHSPLLESTYICIVAAEGGSP